MPKQRYDARFGRDDGAMPMIVPPGATTPGLPQLVDGSVPRLVLLALSGTRMPTSLVYGNDEPSLDAQHVYRNQSGVWTWVEEPAQDARLVSASGGAVRLELVDGSGAVVPGTAFRVHVCPRDDHLTSETPCGKGGVP